MSFFLSSIKFKVSGASWRDLVSCSRIVFLEGEDKGWLIQVNWASQELYGAISVKLMRNYDELLKRNLKSQMLEGRTLEEALGFIYCKQWKFNISLRILLEG